MSATNDTLVDSTGLQTLQDRVDIADVLYKYSSSVDSFDTEGIRSALADDIWAQYGNGEAVEGGDKLVGMDRRGNRDCHLKQHHLLNVYHVTIDGDQAKTLSYLTSYQVFEENPEAAIILVARYHDELKAHPVGMEDQQADHGASVGRVEGRRRRSGEPRRSWAQDLAAQLTGLRIPCSNHPFRRTMATARTACTMTLDPKDLDEVVGIFELFIKDVQEKDYGVLAYHYFVDEDPLTIHVIEWYESPQAMLDHYANLKFETAGRLVQLVKLSPLHSLRQPDAGGGGPDGRVRRRCTSTVRLRSIPETAAQAVSHPSDARPRRYCDRRPEAAGARICPCSDPLGRRSQDAAGIGEEISLLDLGCGDGSLLRVRCRPRSDGARTRRCSRIRSHQAMASAVPSGEFQSRHDGDAAVVPTRRSTSSLRSTPCSTRWTPSWPWPRRRASCASVAGSQSASGGLRRENQFFAFLAAVGANGVRGSAACGRRSAGGMRSRPLILQLLVTAMSLPRSRWPTTPRCRQSLSRAGIVAELGALDGRGICQRRGCPLPPGRRQRIGSTTT